MFEKTFSLNKTEAVLQTYLSDFVTTSETNSPNIAPKLLLLMPDMLPNALEILCPGKICLGEGPDVMLTDSTTVTSAKSYDIVIGGERGVEKPTKIFWYAAEVLSEAALNGRDGLYSPSIGDEELHNHWQRFGVGDGKGTFFPTAYSLVDEDMFEGGHMVIGAFKDMCKR